MPTQLQTTGLNGQLQNTFANYATLLVAAQTLESVNRVVKFRDRGPALYRWRRELTQHSSRDGNDDGWTDLMTRDAACSVKNGRSVRKYRLIMNAERRSRITEFGDELGFRKLVR